MPVTRGKDKGGSYYRWGTKGKRYYYKERDKASRTQAQNKARAQGKAIKAREG